MIDLVLPERPLETPRLVLEPLRGAHAAELFEGLREPQLYRFIPKDPPVSLEALRSRYVLLESRRSDDGSEGWLNWVVRLKQSAQVLGTIEITLSGDRHAYLAYMILGPHQGQGYAREACERVLAHMIDDYDVLGVSAELDTRNLASKRLVEALGFEQTGFTPGADFFKGEASDELRFELRRPRAGSDPSRLDRPERMT